MPSFPLWRLHFYLRIVRVNPWIVHRHKLWQKIEIILHFIQHFLRCLLPSFFHFVTQNFGHKFGKNPRHFQVVWENCVHCFNWQSRHWSQISNTQSSISPNKFRNTKNVIWTTSSNQSSTFWDILDGTTALLKSLVPQVDSWMFNIITPNSFHHLKSFHKCFSKSETKFNVCTLFEVHFNLYMKFVEWATQALTELVLQRVPLNVQLSSTAR